MRQYPQLEFDLALLRSNADAVISRCRGMGIRVCGVVKGVDGLPEAARVLRAAGAAELGTRWPSAAPPVCRGRGC